MDGRAVVDLLSNGNQAENDIVRLKVETRKRGRSIKLFQCPLNLRAFVSSG